MLHTIESDVTRYFNNEFFNKIRPEPSFGIVHASAQNERDRPVKPLWRIVWVVSYAAMTA
jgi:hypothetical protein